MSVSRIEFSTSTILIFDSGIVPTVLIWVFIVLLYLIKYSIDITEILLKMALNTISLNEINVIL